MKQKTQEQCAYCGKIGKMTIEHVIPQCLFTKPLPLDIVKVPACEQCNNAKSADDSYLRDYLVTDASASEHKTARKIFTTKVLSSVRKNKSDLWRSFAPSAHLSLVHCRGGISLLYAGNLDGERIERALYRIVRGLYYRIFQQHIPENCNYSLTRWSPQEFNEFLPLLHKFGFNGPYGCGDAFKCIMQFADKSPFTTAWWLFFYDSICLHVLTEHKESE
ncbi:MAG: hypothetical protein ABFD49_09020 [Armatimonadota bacterium]|nr:HNH endonuclease [bacterium]